MMKEVQVHHFPSQLITSAGWHWSHCYFDLAITQSADGFNTLPEQSFNCQLEFCIISEFHMALEPSLLSTDTENTSLDALFVQAIFDNWMCYP